MEKKAHFSDYYPLFLDIRDFKKRDNPLPSEPFIEGTSSQPDFPGESIQTSRDKENLEDLIIQSGLNGLSPFQTMILLIKSVFEGHAYLTANLLPDDLCKREIIENHGSDHSLVSSFYENLLLYTDGLKEAFQLLDQSGSKKSVIGFESMLYFILSNQLWMFPVSVLAGFDIKMFSNLSSKKAEIYRLNFELSSIMASRHGFIKGIDDTNEQYKARFRIYVLKIGSKEQVIKQLISKLAIANDPEVKSAEDLERKYFNFLINVQSGSSPAPRRSNQKPVFSDNYDNESSEEVEYRLRQLYRSISKNCRESHITTDPNSSLHELDDFFIQANHIYNRQTSDASDVLIQQSELLEILLKVVIYRKNQGLLISFTDFTSGKMMNYKGRPDPEKLLDLARQLDNKIGALMLINHTSFKAKHIADEELAEIHVKYLKQELVFLDERISELISEIDEVIHAKLNLV
ncbi:MAG: hypothetical protein IPH84_11050 [Bacteroidales bacterium]|nr:hypothetical protein [Bacteroidales bacterium]